MSMLSAQCDELRSMAESVGLAMPQAATLMMESADTIWELRCKLSNMVGERERMFRANVEKNRDLMRLMDENAKLRDALKALMMGTNAELCAYRCEPDCKGCSMHHGKDGCTVVDAMELLGIDMYGEPLGIEVG